ncbi:phosphotransferase family protein [Salicibibacter cibi]|uniref:Phosphotransferase family protein n=1 Tax=Salicibibacter cibi TaxID=2743001 RepID=A0A7T6ZB62_9BACI|nr:phosphotransferase family protein [Salicibibacter cibi]QQK80288.1 phosphotransferase family protein [Salicibibacter cibi]
MADSVRTGEELNDQKVKSYLHDRLNINPANPLEIKQFSIGASNLTYHLKCGSWEGVLRRPPLGPLPPKAHDMEREYEILKRLNPVFSLAPKPYIFSEDESVMGAPFYIMETKSGIVIDREFPPGYNVSENDCKNISYLVVDTLVDLHSVDLNKTKLKSFGHPDGFLDRQVHGWIKRYKKAKTDNIPEFEIVAKWLIENTPVSQEATMIHNDYKLNNMMFSHDLKSMTAVLDWEMSTIGDPLFDLGLSLGYWIKEEDPKLLKETLQTVTKQPGFITRRDFIERYAKKSGRDVSSLKFYMILAYFKWAVIIQQIYYRWKRGQTQDNRFKNYDERVKNLMQFSLLAIENEDILY